LSWGTLSSRRNIVWNLPSQKALLQCSISLLVLHRAFPWYPTMMLTVESGRVIGLRVTKTAFGGWEAYDEAFLMVKEKVDAATEAHTTMMAGGSAAVVVERYREHVASNQKRLSLS
jgi:hypothetical protein